MSLGYQEIKFPIKNYCTGHNQYAISLNEAYKAIVNSRITLQIQTVSCICGNCWKNLFSFFTSRKSISLKKLAITWCSDVKLKKSVFEQLTAGISQLHTLEKLSIQINFKNDFLDVIAGWIQDMILKMQKNTNKLSLKFYQICDSNVSDDSRVAQVIQSVAYNNNIKNFSFKYSFDNENFGVRNVQSLQYKTLESLVSVLKTESLKKLKLMIDKNSQLFENRLEFDSFCYRLKQSSVQNLSLLLENTFCFDKGKFNDIQNAWLENNNIQKLQVYLEDYQQNRHFNKQPPSKVVISRFNPNLKYLCLSNFFVDITHIPDSLETLDLKNPSLNLFQDLEIGLVGKVHNLKQLYFNTPNFVDRTTFPPVIECYFKQLELLQIKTIINNKRLLNYIQANTNLHTLKILSNSFNLLNFNLSANAFAELFSTVSKCPHITVLHLTISYNNFMQQSKNYQFGGYLEEFRLEIVDAFYSIVSQIAPIFEALNYNTSLLKLELFIRLYGFIVFPQLDNNDYNFNIINDSLTQLSIKSTKTLPIPKTLKKFEEKTHTRYISMLQQCIFNQHITPYLHFNPQHTYWDLYIDN